MLPDLVDSGTILNPPARPIDLAARQFLSGHAVYMATDAQGQLIRRYTVRLLVSTVGQPPGAPWRHVEFRVVTSLGEHKASAMAVLRQAHLDDGMRLRTVEVVRTEDDFVVSPDQDLLDYWGGCD